MGSSASVVVDNAPLEIKSLIEICNIQLVKILEHDHDIIDEEMSKIFKKHSKIIETITGHTKSQLRKFFSMSQPVKSSGLFALLGLHNNYSEFFKLLFLKKENIDNESFKASAQADYNEGILKSIIGTSTSEDILRFRVVYETERRVSLSEVVKLRAKKNSHIQNFLLRALRGDRVETDKVDRDAAALQAKEIHRAGASRFFGVEEEPIFNILATASRAQCSAISKAYQELFGMTLATALKKKFGGNIGKLLILWVQPIHDAVATLIRNSVNKLMPNQLAIAKIIAKYDKQFLSQVDHSCFELFNIPLLKLLGKALSGNLYKAVKGWLENQSPDCGYEYSLEKYIEDLLASGKKAENLYDDPEDVQNIQELLQKRSDAFERFMIERQIHFELPEFKDKDKKSAKSPSASKSSVGVLEAVGAHKKAVKYGVKLGGEAYASKVKRVSRYLSTFFAGLDEEKTGEFATEDFWCIVKTLPLQDFALSVDAVDSMSEFCEWEHNGHINYHDAVGELSDSIIHAVEEGEDGGDILAVIDRLEEEDRLAAIEAEKRKKSLAKTSSHHSTASTSSTSPLTPTGESKHEKKIKKKKSRAKLPENIERYIFDTVDAYDYDCKGYLNYTELKKLVRETNVNVTLDSFTSTDEDMYTHQDIAKVFAKVIDLTLKEGDENLILSFVDKDSGMNFWYDVLNATTKWAAVPVVEPSHSSHSPLTASASNFSPVAAASASSSSMRSSVPVRDETATTSAVHYIEETTDDNEAAQVALPPLTEEEKLAAKEPLTEWLKDVAKVVPPESIAIYVENLIAADVGSVATMAKQVENVPNFLQTVSISHGNAARIQQALIRDKMQQLAKTAPAADKTSTDKPIDEKDLCLICMENRKCMVFFPCGHLCVCEPCDALMNRKQGVLCIMCRVEIVNRAKLFVS